MLSPSPLLKIMIVEDSRVQRQQVVELCLAAGIHQIMEAANGREALAILQFAEIKPTLILCDLEMPDMDGVELIQHLAEHKLNCPLALLSSKDYHLLVSVETMARSYQLPILGVIQKPLTQTKLQQLLQQHLNTPVTLGSAKAATKKTGQPPISVTEIQQALLNNEFIPYYQPKVTLASGLLHGVEVLARWQHPHRGLVAPDFFIPIMEQQGLIDQLTHQILEQAFSQWRRWADKGLRTSMAINLSAKSLSNTGLADLIAHRAQQHRIDAEYLVLEITETAFTSNLASSLACCARLRLMKFGLSIDDFGTGFSSIQQLSRFPFTELKIDRSLVDQVSQRAHLDSIVSSTIEMANKLHITTVAEGIETLEDWLCLKKMGCQLAQGYFIAKPMAGEQLAAWLRHGTRHLRQL